MKPSTFDFTPAKRGDLVIVGRKVGNYIIGKPYSEHDEYRICVVTNITREGAVKAYRDRDDGVAHRLDQVINLIGIALVPAVRIDVDAAMKAAEDHTWPGGQPWMPFDSLDEVRAALKPHLLDGASPAGKEAAQR